MNDGVVYLLSYLITPLVLIVAGVVMWRFPPGYGENVGYKTRRSRSSEAAWDFAQVFWGRLILFISIPMMALSVCAGVYQTVREIGDEAGFVIFCIVMAVQLVPIFVSIAVTESELKRRFG